MLHLLNFSYLVPWIRPFIYNYGAKNISKIVCSELWEKKFRSPWKLGLCIVTDSYYGDVSIC